MNPAPSRPVSQDCATLATLRRLATSPRTRRASCSSAAPAAVSFTERLVRPASDVGSLAVLEGVRVIDVSRVLAGPLSAQTLADFGAEVVKLERPGVGDDTRSWEPSFGSKSDPDVRESAYFCSVNRGKRSVTLDFTRPEGAAIVRELARNADVLVENYKVGTLARYGLGYEQLAEVNPRLIYVSVTGFGQTGPYRTRAGYDTIIQALGGLLSITGQRD
jgi:crotonobetainyl-CoA:carnitine CoA-transferase CaiB-like acyl-CoA transferase